MRTTLPLLPLLVACGGGGDDEIVADGPLTCDWFDDDTNCWATTRAEAGATCNPPQASVGTLDATNTTCTFDDGTVITFAQPLVLTGDGPEDWDFRIDGPGGSCTFVSNDDGILLEVDGTTVEETLDGLDVYMTCPDGSVWGPAGAFDLFECDWSNLPGHSHSWSEGYVAFSLLGEGGLTFQCEAN